MQKFFRCSCWTLVALLATLATASFCQAEERTANKVVINDPATAHSLPAPRKAHPLDPVLEYAQVGYARMKNDIRDYSCVLIKRERVEGKLVSYQHLEGKIRHRQQESGKVTQPFSVYLKFLAPSKVKGREVLYVEGANDGDLIARRGGQRLASLTMRLEPTGRLAMEGQRYPITEIGILTLVKRLVEVMEEDIQLGGAPDVQFFDDAKLGGRSCTHIQVIHPTRGDHRYHMARVFIDKEMNVPVYYAAYDWPATEGGKPVLLEEYAYTSVKLNVGLSDLDFQRSNPKYGFSDDSDEERVARE